MKTNIVLSFMALMAFCRLMAPAAEAQFVSDSNWNDAVKTVTLYKNGVDLEAPILMLGGNDQLLLRFDVLGPETGNYRYRIQHCDRNWHIDDMQPYEYINGFEEAPIENHNSSFTTMTDYVNYFQYLPNKYSQLLISGNYVVSVFPDDDPDSILLTRRFVVTEESMKLDASLALPYNNVSIMQRREVQAQVDVNRDYRGSLLQPSINPAYFHLFVQQNGRLDNRRELAFSGYDRGSLCYRNREENLFDCGNSFRYFDISNIRTPMYNVARYEDFGGEWFAMLKPLEDRSSKPFITEQTLNGGMKVNVWDRDDKMIEADYVYVNFILPMQYPFMNGSIYVVGDLTQWHLDEHSRMEYQPDMHAYTLRLLLKQGYYAYQLLFQPVGETQGLTATLEGDHFETPNNYTIYAYYRGLNDRYDRLAAIRRL